MAAQEIIQFLSTDAPDEMKVRIRRLCSQFSQSIDVGNPIMFIPKCIGDRIGESNIEAIAWRFSTLIRGTIIIQYNPHLDAYCIGPVNNIPQFKMFRVLKRCRYGAIPSSYIPGARVTLHGRSAFVTIAAPAAPIFPVPDAATLQTTTATQILEGFLLFRNYKYAEYCKEDSEASRMHKQDFFKTARDMWKAASITERDYYAQMAFEIKQHSQEAKQQQ